MYVGRDFDVADVGENEVYTLDFANDLGDGETLSTTTWTIAVVTGTDASPSSHLSGSPVIDGTASSQRITGLLGGVLYRVQAIVTTSASNTLSLYSHVLGNTPY